MRELIETRDQQRPTRSSRRSRNIRRFHLLTKELDHDDDEVTATMKVRRANIQSKYAREIEGLYAS